ncbi:hypothetical protein JCM10212_005715 [Sporobolomyces blumeae]
MKRSNDKSTGPPPPPSSSATAQSSSSTNLFGPSNATGTRRARSETSPRRDGIGLGLARLGDDQDERGGEWVLVFDPGRPVPNDLKSFATQLSTGTPSSSSPPLASDLREGPLATTTSTSTSSSSSSSRSKPPVLKRLKPNGFGSLTKARPLQQGDGQRGQTRDDGTRRTDPSRLDDLKFGDVLKVFRINLKDLKKRDEYQILHVDLTGPALSESERVARKHVKADLAK